MKKIFLIILLISLFICEIYAFVFPTAKVVLSEKNVKLEVENKFLNKEVKALKAENIKLLKFQEKKEKVSNRIKKILSKLESLKANNG